MNICSPLHRESSFHFITETCFRIAQLSDHSTQTMEEYVTRSNSKGIFVFYFCLQSDFECTCVSACICMHCICKGCVSACVHQSLWERMRVVSNQKSLRLYSSVIIFATCNSLLRKTPSPATIFPNNIHTSPKEDLERQGLCKKGSTLIV